MYLILLISVFITNSLGQIIISGYPNQTSIRDFEKSRFTGIWYDIWRIPNHYDAGEKCKFYDITVYQNGSLSLNISFTNIKTGKKKYVVGIANQRKECSSVFDYYYAKNSGTLEVLDTDYDNYNVLSWVQPYGNNTDKYFLYAWIGSRKRTLSNEKSKIALEVLRRNNILTELEFDDQQNCSCNDY